MNRRQFIGTSGALCAVAARSGAGEHSQRLRILILGGTRFIGVHITELALKRGHSVTLFNRGRSAPNRFPNVELLKGDRNGQLDALRGHSWDAVIDDSGYVPRQVRLSAELLAPHVQRYVFISSISAYASLAKPVDESAPLGKLTDPSVETINGDTYGPLKALCEQAAASAMPHRLMVLRPGLVVGPEDYTDRFTYWPARAARGGPMLAPGTPAAATQFIDARDLARFTLDCIEHNTVGTFNVVTPPGHVTMGQLVAESIAAAEALAQPQPKPSAVWVPADFLERQKVEPGTDLPMWYPATGDDASFAEVSDARAIAAGLRITPLAVTTRDTLAWFLKRPESERRQLKAGLSPEREAQLLASWRAA